jgi:hypothetical protein
MLNKPSSQGKTTRLHRLRVDVVAGQGGWGAQCRQLKILAAIIITGKICRSQTTNATQRLQCGELLLRKRIGRLVLPRRRSCQKRRHGHKSGRRFCVPLPLI